MRHPHRLLPILAGTALLGTAPTLAAQAVQDMSTAHEVNAQTITDAVEDEFAFHPAVPLNEIDVRTDDGVVTLTGDVESLLARDYATRLAETVKGVQRVENDIEVEPSGDRMDWELEADAEQALLHNRTTESYEVDVNVAGREVRLTGMVESWAERRAAERVVKGVRGITAVDNDIDVEFDAERTDAEIRRDVEARLRWDALVDGGLVEVGVEDGVVHFTGAVGSAAEKSRVALDGWVAGVEDVDVSGLEVERWARDAEMAKDPSLLNDAAIEDAIEMNLVWDARVVSFDIAVDVDNGVATLRGIVDNLAARRAADEVARETYGVVRVENRIRVRPETPDDEEIAENIEEAIARDPYLERFEIDATVLDGTAYLYGTVDTYFEKARADTVTATVYGVTEVNNHLAVEDDSLLVEDPYLGDPYLYGWDWYDYEPGVTYERDMDIHGEIRDELWWSPFVDSAQVNVTVVDGVATLTGTVDSRAERRAATENAYEGGAVWVDNDLKVEQSDDNSSERP